MADGSLPPPGPSGQNLLAQLASAYGGVTAIPAVQRSQYLADALQQMSQQGQNIKSPLALGSSLLAEALLQFGRGKNNAALLKQVQSGQSDMAQGVTMGIYGTPPSGGPPDGGSAPPAAAPPPASPSAAPNTGLAAALNPAAPPPQSPQAHVLADLVAGGLSPMAASGLVGNFTQESGPNLALNNPGEGAVGMANWEGSRGQAAQRYFGQHGGPSLDNQAAFTLQELHGPESGALAKLNATTDPTSAAAAGLAYERPAGYRPGGNPANASGWSNRAAQANAAYSAFQQSAQPQSGTASTSAGDQQAPAPRPIQISTGPDPSIASPSAQGPVGASPYPVAPQAAPSGSQAPAPAGPASPQAAGAGFGSSIQGPPTGPPATPQERQYLQWAFGHPPGSVAYMGGIQLAQEIQRRVQTPLAPPKDMTWGPSGQAVPIPGTTYHQVPGGAPGTVGEQDPFGKTSYQAIPNAVMDRQLWDQGANTYKPLNGVQPQISGAFQPHTVVSQAPGAPPSVVQASPFDPEKARAAFITDPQVQRYNDARTSVGGLFNAIQGALGNNGVLDTAAVGTVLQTLMPGSNPRTSTNEDLIKHLGLPDALFGGASNMLGKGFITPESVQQIASVANAYLSAQRASAQQRMDSDTSAAKNYGYPGGVPGEALPAAPGLPSFRGIGGAAPPAGNSAAVLQDARAAIARGAPRGAVAQRLQGMGINPAGL